MHYARFAILAAGIGVALAVSAPEATGPGTRTNITAGKELFRQNCSTCHGMDAKGFRSTTAGLIYDPNSADESRRVPPADLTALTIQNSGKFPEDRVRESVYNKGVIPIPAHGTPDMPAWGHAFDGMKSNPKLLEQRVNDLVGYIQSIQDSRK